MTTRHGVSLARVNGRLSLVAACVVSGGFAVGAAADPPLPPVPEELPAAVTGQPLRGEPRADQGVQPTGLATPAAGRSLAPVPLGKAADATDRATPSLPPAANWTVLAAILGAFAVLGVFRLRSAHRPRPLPPEVFDVLGEGSLGGQHAVRVVRFGPRTLLVGLSSSGSQTLAEIDDPAVTERIVAACVPRPAARGPLAARMTASAGAAVLAVLVPAAAWATDAAANAPAVVPAFMAEPAAAESGLPDTVPGESAAAGTAAAAVGPAATAIDGAAQTDGARGTPAGSVLQQLPAGLFGERPLTALLPSMLLLGVATLAPAVLLMTTCFVRMSVVLTLVRQGLGAAQVPSNQILASLAIFLSALVMWPVWTQAWQAGVTPYQEGRLSAEEAFEQGGLPIRRWMAAQIEQAGNRDTMLLFLARHPAGVQQAATYDDVPLESLLPAFLVSELETAFTIGFRLLLPFLVLDILVATLVVSTGLVMLPPTLVSLPLKLLVFVAADGWTLVVQTLLSGVAVG